MGNCAKVEKPASSPSSPPPPEDVHHVLPSRNRRKYVMDQLFCECKLCPDVSKIVTDYLYRTCVFTTGTEVKLPFPDNNKRVDLCGVWSANNSEVVVWNNRQGLSKVNLSEDNTCRELLPGNRELKLEVRDIFWLPRHDTFVFFQEWRGTILRSVNLQTQKVTMPFVSIESRIHHLTQHQLSSVAVKHRASYTMVILEADCECCQLQKWYVLNLVSWSIQELFFPFITSNAIKFLLSNKNNHDDTEEEEKEEEECRFLVQNVQTGESHVCVIREKDTANRDSLKVFVEPNFSIPCRFIWKNVLRVNDNETNNIVLLNGALFVHASTSPCFPLDYDDACCFIKEEEKEDSESQIAIYRLNILKLPNGVWIVQRYLTGDVFTFDNERIPKYKHMCTFKYPRHCGIYYEKLEISLTMCGLYVLLYSPLLKEAKIFK